MFKEPTILLDLNEAILLTVGALFQVHLGPFWQAQVVESTPCKQNGVRSSINVCYYQATNTVGVR